MKAEGSLGRMKTEGFVTRSSSFVLALGLLALSASVALPSRALDIPYAVATFFGGTSMLIMVGVLLDTMRQMETHLLMRHYDGFLKKGKLRGRF